MASHDVFWLQATKGVMVTRLVRWKAEHNRNAGKYNSQSTTLFYRFLLIEAYLLMDGHVVCSLLAIIARSPHQLFCGLGEVRYFYRL